MITNVFQLPPLEQFEYEQRLEKKYAQTFGALKGWWQNELNDMFASTLAGNGCDFAVFEMLQEKYTAMIRAANTPEEVKKVYKHLDCIIKYTDCVLGAANNYAEKLMTHITTLEKDRYGTCPCCGAIISLEFVEEMKIAYEDLREQIKFYEVFLEQRRQDMERMTQKVERNEINVRA